MICKQCNHKLPDDSEFCQYCGNKINSEEVSETSSPDEALNEILKIQAKATIDAMEANADSQPDNEGDDYFGLVPEKPIFTLALKSVDGEKEYLNKLYTVNGEKISYTRRGSTSVEGINGMIDIYDTFLPSGQPYKTIYINMYGAKASNAAPKGFDLDPKLLSQKSKITNENSEKNHTVKKRSFWCSNKLLWVLIGCAIPCLVCTLVGVIGQNIIYENSQDAYNHHKATIKNDTVGCGSVACEYCGGIKTEYSYNEYGYPVFRDLFAFYYKNDNAYSLFGGILDVSFLIFNILVVFIVVLCLVRFNKNIKSLFLKVFRKKNISIIVVSTVLLLSLIANGILAFNVYDLNRAYRINRDKVEQYEEEISDVRAKVNFIDKHVVFIENNGSNLYHKYDCYKFKGKDYWVHNVEYAIYRGYKPCSFCCD